MALKVTTRVKVEIKCLLKAKFIQTARYVKWLSNIVHVIKKSGKLYVGIDFRNLNNSTPKDEYPMPVADMLVELAAKNTILSFIDGHSSYN